MKLHLLTSAFVCGRCLPTKHLQMLGAVCLLLILGSGSLGHADDAMTTIEALEAGVAEWAERINFYGTYVMRQGTSKSFEAGLQGQFGKAVGEPEDRETGLVVKLGDFVRISSTTDTRYPKPEPGKARYVSVRSRECVGSPYFYFNFSTAPEDSSQTLIVNRRPPSTPRVLSPCGVPDLLTPFDFHGGDTLKPISIFFDKAHGRAVKAEVQADEHNITVRLEASGDGRRSVRQLYFARKYKPPLLTKVETVTFNADGSETMRSLVRAEKIVPAQGGPIASVLRLVMGPARTVEGPIVYICRLWVSEDMGRRAPGLDDLAVEIGPEVEIFGLRNAPPTGTRRRFALNKYTPEDLLPPSAVGPFGGYSPAVPKSGGQRQRVLLAMLGAAALGITGVAIWIARARRRTT